MPTLADKQERASVLLRQLDRVVVAFSGGVDSSVLLALAVRELGERALAALAVSPSLADGERSEATALARGLGARLTLVETKEFENPRYLANSGDRCFWCRSALADALEPIARRERATVVYGAIVDDLGDDRPGMRAAEQRGIRAPLLEAGLNKDDIRTLARNLNLPVSDKPAMACLSSRVPAGRPVTVDALRRVEAAEHGLKRLGFGVVRVRDHGELARIELGREEIARASDPELRSRVLAAVRSAGYRLVTLDLEGYRPAGSASGSATENGGG